MTGLITSQDFPFRPCIKGCKAAAHEAEVNDLEWIAAVPIW